MESTPFGVRKGAWTEEEDILLRNCIEKHGEGKWHQVPLKAGLNRCRKSCRLRWLNYLRPNIKRGGFASDEVDLIIRLHKLLGNRWSLIARRLPGRTANDVKNYWNTHLQKKTVARGEEVKIEAQKTMETKIIKPRPRSFSKNLTWLRGNNFMVDNTQPGGNNTQPGGSLYTKPTPTSPLEIDGIPWWDDLFVDKEINNGITAWSITGLEEQPLTGLWSTEKATVPGKIAGDSSSVHQEVQNGWSDFSIDVDLWDLLSNEQEIML